MQKILKVGALIAGSPILGQNLVNGWVSFHFPRGTSLPKKILSTPPGLEWNCRLLFHFICSEIPEVWVKHTLKMAQSNSLRLFLKYVCDECLVLCVFGFCCFCLYLSVSSVICYCFVYVYLNKISVSEKIVLARL